MKATLVLLFARIVSVFALIAIFFYAFPLEISLEGFNRVTCLALAAASVILAGALWIPFVFIFGAIFAIAFAAAGKEFEISGDSMVSALTSVVFDFAAWVLVLWIWKFIGIEIGRLGFHLGFALVLSLPYSIWQFYQRLKSRRRAAES